MVPMATKTVVRVVIRNTIRLTVSSEQVGPRKAKAKAIFLQRASA